MFKLLVAFVGLAIIASSQGEDDVGHPDRNADLIAVVQIHRHGQRVPVTFYANDAYSDSSNWPADGGQLTNTGKSQHWNLGRFTRRRYDGFLPPQYDPDQIYVQTTDVDRTHMSVQSNLAGIFPPSGPEVWNRWVRWQPIPVRVLEESVVTAIPDCGIYETETANIFANAEEFKQINNDYADVFAYLTENSGSNISSISKISTIFDPVSIEIQFGFEQPKWVANVYPEPVTSLAGLYFWGHSYSDSQKRLTAGSTLNTFLSYFDEMWEDSSSNEKYQLYSAHDYNLAAILNTLGDYDRKVPGFASTIYFELRNKSGNGVLNIYFRDNNVVKPVTINGCSFDCPLSDAKTILSPWLLDADTWETECAATRTAHTDLLKARNDPQIQQTLKDLQDYSKVVRGQKKSRSKKAKRSNK